MVRHRRTLTVLMTLVLPLVLAQHERHLSPFINFFTREICTDSCTSEYDPADPTICDDGGLKPAEPAADYAAAPAVGPAAGRAIVLQSRGELLVPMPEQGGSLRDGLLWHAGG